jgi:hypothetical protein
MIAVKFSHCGYTTPLSMMLSKTIQLRDVQQDLCSFFKQSFPKKMAKVKVYNRTYDDFMEYPLEDAIGEEIEATVTFEDTKDPYFYDVIDRKTFKCSLEEEIQWEKETGNGETCLTFREWLRSRNELPTTIAWENM